MNIDNTIQNPEWIKKNKASLQDTIPATWTHMHNAKPVLREGLEKMGVRWNNETEFMFALANLYTLGVLQCDKALVRIDPNYFLYDGARYLG